MFDDVAISLTFLCGSCSAKSNEPAWVTGFRRGLIAFTILCVATLLCSACQSSQPRGHPPIVPNSAPNASSSKLTALQIYNVSDIGKPGVPKLEKFELDQIHDVIAKVQPRYQRFLKFTFFGPGDRLAVVLSRSPIPPDIGPESYVLNSCKMTAQCPYACRLQIKYPLGTVVPLSGYACVSPSLWFLNHR